MNADDELIAFETDGWEALSADGAAATAFYDRVLDDGIVMLLPGAEYSALVSSGEVRRDGGWRVAFHQQTPR